MRFFDKSFLLADINIEVVLGRSFPFLSNANVKFGIRRLLLRRDIAAKVMPTVKKMELVNTHKFVKVVLNKNPWTFVVYVASLKNNGLHLSKASLIAALQ